MLKFLLIFLISFEVYGACTSATRSNYTTGQVLTSSQLNQDFNTIYDFAAAYDGGCVSAGTIEAAALNSTEFAPILKAVVQGCEASYVDSNTIGISKCKIAVDGNLFEVATQTNVTWGCSGCSSEATGSFYVTVKDASTFTLGITTTAPGKDGYSGTDKVVGGFYNNSLLNIASNSVMTFLNTNVGPPPNNIPWSGTSTAIYAGTVTTVGAVSSETADFIDGSCANSSNMTCPFLAGMWAAAPQCLAGVFANSNGFCYTETTTSLLTIRCNNAADAAAATDFNKFVICIGTRLGP